MPTHDVSVSASEQQRNTAAADDEKCFRIQVRNTQKGTRPFQHAGLTLFHLLNLME